MFRYKQGVEGYTSALCYVIFLDLARENIGMCREGIVIIMDICLDIQRNTFMFNKKRV